MRAFRLFLVVTVVLAVGFTPAEGAPPPQSPIKFEGAVNERMDAPVFTDYLNTVTLTMTSMNHASTGNLGTDKPAVKKIEGTLPLNHTATVQIDTGTYKFHDLHFHKPQEHVRAAAPNTYPLELHLVHKLSVQGQPDKNLALGFWIEVGQDNPALAQIAANLPDLPTNPGDADKTKDIANFKMTDLKPSNVNRFFRYDGSLTTFKTNDEVTNQTSQAAVTWIFFKDPLALTQANITKFTDHLAITGARGVQALDLGAGGHKLRDSVPEPSTLSLLAVAGLLAGQRRRR